MKAKKTLSILSLAVIGALYGISSASAIPILGSAQNFAVLGHETVTNGHSAPNETTKVFGDLGVAPGTSVTGFYPDGIVSGGTIHINDAVAQLALADATTAYNFLAGSPTSFNYTGIVLGSTGYNILTPGTYHFDTSAQLTGMLTLDFQSNPDAEFIFQIGSTLTTASESSISIINGNSLSSVYWQVGSSATLGSDTAFAGNILAQASVGLDPRAEIICGRAFALTGSVTLNDNLITNNCNAENFGTGTGDFDSIGFSGGTVNPVPVPAPLILMVIGAAELLRRHNRHYLLLKH